MRNKKGFIGLEAVVVTAVMLALSVYASKQIINANKMAVNKIINIQEMENIKHNEEIRTIVDAIIS